MSWKDELNILKKDRLAILILLCLNVVLLLLIFIFHTSSSDKKTIAEQENLNRWEAKLTTQEAVNSSSKSSTAPQKVAENKTTTKRIYPYIPKLKEGERININTADTTLLKRIPGIGSVYAKRIYDRRIEYGSYTSIRQLRKIKGISPKVYTKIEPYIFVEADSVR